MEKAKTSAIFAGALSLTIVALWIALDAVLVSERGLELTDEGLYLLAAREIGGTSQWGFPFGWHTAPFYALAGGDVAAFRTLGAVILSLAGAAFGFSAFLAAVGPQSLQSLLQFKRLTPQAILFTAVGFLGSLFYYAGLIRAPSYNWVNLVGLLIAGAGFFFFLWSVTTKSEDRWSLGTHSSLAVTSLGLVYTVVAKPTSPILFVLAALIVLRGLTNMRTGAIFVLELGAFSVAFVAVFLAVGLWPLNFWTFFVSPLSTPPLLSEHSLNGALVDLILSPLQFASLLPQRSVVGAVLLVFAAGVFFLSIWLKIYGRYLMPVGYALALLSALSIFGLREWIFSGFEPIERTAALGLSLAVMTLLLLSVFLVIASPYSNPPRIDRTRIRIGVALFATWLPFVSGFGSGHGVIRQSGLAVGGFLVAIFVLLPDIRRGIRSTMNWLPAFLVITLMLVVTLVDGHRAPYRMQPMANQTQEITLGDAGQSKVLVDAETAEVFEGLKEILQRSGYEVGDPIVGLVWHWNATWPYALGAEVPPGLMPTLWGYENSPELLDYKIRIMRDQGFDFGEAWWLVSDPDTLAQADADTLEAAYGRILEGEKVSFPADFERMGEVGGIEVYRLKN